MKENMLIGQDKHAGLANLKAIFAFACGTVFLLS